MAFRHNCVSFDAKQPISSVRTIDKTMSDGHERGLQPKTRPSSAPPRPHGNWTKVAATQVAAAQTTAVGPFGLRSHAQVRTHACTHTVLLAVPPLPSRCASWRAVDVTSVCLVSALAPRAAATLLVIAEATSRVRTSARKCGRPCCPCGCGLRHSPDAGVTREVARGSRDPRAVMGVRARLGAAPRAARNWGLVRPLLPAWPGASAVVFLAFLTRPAGGVAGECPSESPNGCCRWARTRPRGR